MWRRRCAAPDRLPGIAAILKVVNLGLRFLLELAALAALAYWGARTGSTVLADLLLAIAAPLAFATLWGLFAAPRAPRRLPDPWRLLFEASAFAVAALALAGADEASLAGVFLVLALLSALAVRALGEAGT